MLLTAFKTQTSPPPPSWIHTPQTAYILLKKSLGPSYTISSKDTNDGTGQIYQKKVYSSLALGLNVFTCMASELGLNIPTTTVSRLLDTYNALCSSCICLYATLFWSGCGLICMHREQSVGRNIVLRVGRTCFWNCIVAFLSS